jgi:hypothetical protein
MSSTTISSSSFFDVYQIINTNMDRKETWEIQRVPIFFPTEDEAKEYIIGQTKHFVPECTNLAIDSKTQEQKNEFYTQFCFSEKEEHAHYLKYRKFFLGYPPVEKLKLALLSNGIEIRVGDSQFDEAEAELQSMISSEVSIAIRTNRRNIEWSCSF